MSEQQTTIPVAIIGDDAALNQHCRAHIARYPALRLIAETPIFSGSAVPESFADQRGVCVVIVNDHTALRPLVDHIRRYLPSWSILAVSPPPAILHPHLAGWLATGSPVDIGAAALVIASGGWLSERLAQLTAIQQTAHQAAAIRELRAA